MTALILLTGSVPVQQHSIVPCSPRVSLSVHDSIAKNDSASPPRSISLHLEVSRRRDSTSVEELGFSSGGIGKGRNSGSGGGGDDWRVGTFSGGSSDRSKISAYYQEMLKSNPMNSLLLGNYGRFLHEVEGDLVKAEEYYGRAILASPCDGEVLSLYGKLIWETQRDEDRAKSYFDQALHASPDDCMVLGSYAHFMWEAEVGGY